MKQILAIAFLIISLVSCGGEESSEGDVFFENREYKKAISAYDEYLKLYPKNLKSLYNRGRSYEELKQYDKSLADFLLILDIDKDNTSALLSMAKHQYREGDFEKSKGYAEHAIKVKDDLSGAHFWLARSYHHAGDFKNAVISYNNAINLDREYGEAYLFRGALNAADGKKKAACKDFQKAKELKVPQADNAIRKHCK